MGSEKPIAARRIDPRAWLAAAATFVAAFAVYLPKTANYFTFDDGAFILRNPNLQDWRSAIGEFGRDQARLYRPLRSMALAALTHAFGQRRALPYHLAGIFFHASCSALTALVVWTLVADPPAALFAGLIFALHPAHADRVANITGSFDLLGLTLGWTAWLLALTAVRTGRTRRAWLAALAMLLGCLASEEALMVWPLAALSLGLSGERRGRARALLQLAAVAGAYLCIRTLVIGGAARTATYAAGSLRNTIWTMAVVVWRYVGLLFFPVGLTPAYAPAIHVRGDAVAVAALLGVAGLLAVAVAAARRAPTATMAIGWFFLGLAPFSNLLPGDTLMAERYLYAGLGGFALAGGALLAALRRRRRTTSIVLAAILIVYGAGVESRIRAWGDPLRLWTQAATREPNSFLANLNAGYHTLTAGRPADAARFAGRANLLDRRRAEPLQQLADIAFQSDQPAEGMRLLAAAIAADPSYCASYDALSSRRVKAGDYAGAADAAAAALRCNPDDARAHYILAFLFYTAGRCGQAAPHLEAALTDPFLPERQAAIDLREKCRP